MDILVAILSITVALTLGAMSPGPSFVMVARTALSVSRRHGLAAAVGMGAGGALFATAALLGLHALLAAVPSLYAVLKVLGGGYLIYLGYRIWRGARDPLMLCETTVERQTAPIWRSLSLGLVTQVSNPKTAIVYASVFASLLPREVPIIVVVALPVLIFLIETVWYSIVAVGLSAPSPRAYYLGSKAWIDRAAGGAMSALGAKLIFDARQP